MALFVWICFLCFFNSGLKAGSAVCLKCPSLAHLPPRPLPIVWNYLDSTSDGQSTPCDGFRDGCSHFLSVLRIGTLSRPVMIVDDRRTLCLSCMSKISLKLLRSQTKRPTRERGCETRLNEKINHTTRYKLVSKYFEFSGLLANNLSINPTWTVT